MEIADEHLYQLALVRMEGSGTVVARQLLAAAGSAGDVFRMSKTALMKTPMVGRERAAVLYAGKDKALRFAEQELKLMHSSGIRQVFIDSPEYPYRLRECSDAPLLLFYKGKVHMNPAHTLGIVGTRKSTEYGKQCCYDWVKKLAGTGICIISGMAYGIDAHAHQAALDNGLTTIGVMGHGLHKVYPHLHRGMAKKMMENGGLMSEYFVQDEMMPHNFPMRNRIVAGLCDALLVVESDLGGGAIITAQLAHSYNRQVFAIPGRVDEKSSRGCNELIRSYKAAICCSAEELMQEMNWNTGPNIPVKKERQMRLALGGPEENIIAFLEREGVSEIDKIIWHTGLTASEVSSVLLELELEQQIITLPGKRYRLAR